MTLGERLRSLREKTGLTQKELATRLKVPNQNISNYERDFRQPDYETLQKLADYYDVSTDFLLGRSAKQAFDMPDLTKKDEQNIMKDLEAMINNLESKNGMASFDGHTVDELDEEDRELLIASLEQSMRLAKRIAKQKFTPKKYRKEQE